MAGVYKYYCEIHPWATGMVTVYGKDGTEPSKTYDETKPPLIVTSVSSYGSVMVENNDSILLPNKDLRVEISGHVQEVTKSKNVEIIIIRPDKTTETLRTATNERGYYHLTTKLDNKWQSELYEVIAMYGGKKLGHVSFSVRETVTVGFGVIIPSNVTELEKMLSLFAEKKIVNEEFTKRLQNLDFPQKGISELIKRLNHLQENTN